MTQIIKLLRFWNILDFTKILMEKHVTIGITTAADFVRIRPEFTFFFENLISISAVTAKVIDPNLFEEPIF